MKRLIKVLEVLFLVLMIGLCGMVFMAGNGKVPYIFGYRILQVISNSMSPTIETETCIVIRKVEAEDIAVGDIITFVSEAPEIRGYLNTHRVYDITKDSGTGETLYITKGDAYEQPDSYPVEYEQIAGEFVGELPFGRALFKGIRFLADRNNYFIIVILPLFFCFASYAKDLINAISGRGKDEEDEAEFDESDEVSEVGKDSEGSSERRGASAGGKSGKGETDEDETDKDETDKDEIDKKELVREETFKTESEVRPERRVVKRAAVKRVKVKKAESGAQESVAEETDNS